MRPGLKTPSPGVYRTHTHGGLPGPMKRAINNEKGANQMCSQEGEQGWLAGWSVGFSWDISSELGS